MNKIEKYSTATITCYFDEDEGYYFESSNTGNVYDLLEGMSYKGSTTSDITFIMIGNNDTGYTGLLNFIFGAADLDYMLNTCLDFITDYEKGELDPLEKF